ncbi:ATP-binding protein [Thalassotalea hakodatensis]|uniref:ATP-binding protein n=1 Tax=Thalassotalea hakodatensis TaxID=3030492 RepID=UPI002573AE0F|nr:ATP-binding protein [Thalassotalea hakodatensis]
MIFFGLLLHAIIWILATSASSYTAAHVIFEGLDKDLKQQAQYVNFSTRLFQSLFSKFAINEGYDPLKDGVEIGESVGLDDFNLVIWNFNGDLIYRSPNAPGFDFPNKNGFTNDTFVIKGEESEWRIFNKNIDGVFWASVGMNTEQARQSAIDFGIKALYPMILIIPLTIFGVYIGSKKGMGAIKKISNEIAHQKPASLMPIDEQNIPEEVFPLVASINGLLKRLDVAIENEHRFTANASHELQTPLAAIKAELQLCQRSSDNPEVINVLDRISSRVERAVYTVQQLLTLARIESQESELKVEDVDLKNIVLEDLADLAHLAIDRDLGIDFLENEPWQIKGNKETLSILIRNLLTNAFRYATPGSQIEVSANVTTQHVQFYVANDSKFITEEEREKMIDSFYRIPGNDKPGAGLGLSIVQRIVKVHHAELEIDTWKDNKGVMVKVNFTRV